MERCSKVLACGHQCFGFEGESSHPACLVSDCPAVCRFQSGTDECAICLGELQEEPCLELGCGHIWHYDCLKEQLRVAQPNRARRIQFVGFTCGICGQFCRHVALDGVLRSVSNLKAKVDAMVLDQAKVDDLADSPAVTTRGDAYYNRVLEYGLHIYAFYLCAICDEPYFGGTVSCAQGTAGGDERDVPAAERLCQRCNGRGNAVCSQNTHQAFYVWKCRYCCSRATFVCYGSVHLCDACHDRDGQLKRGQSLPTFPCPGAHLCPLPFRPPRRTTAAASSTTTATTTATTTTESVTSTAVTAVTIDGDAVAFHDNGAAPSNEQVLFCAWCASNPPGEGDDGDEDGTDLSESLLPGSPNMVFNPDGALGRSGWTAPPAFRPFETEPIEVPIHDCTTNFVSDFRTCAAEQVIDLRQFTSRPDRARIEVTARYRARTDCPSTFRLTAMVLATASAAATTPSPWQFRSTAAAPFRVQRYDTGSLQAPPDHWALARLTTERTAHARYLVITAFGKDSRFWAGWFGSKFTRCSARILRDDDYHDDGDDHDGDDHEGANGDAEGGHPQQRRGPLRTEAFDRVARGDESILCTLQPAHFASPRPAHFASPYGRNRPPFP